MSLLRLSFMDSKSSHAIQKSSSAGMISSSTLAHSIDLVCVQPSLAIFVSGASNFFASPSLLATRAIPAHTHTHSSHPPVALVGVCVYAFCARPSKLLSLLAARGSWRKIKVQASVCCGRRDKRPESTRFSHRRLRSQPHLTPSHCYTITRKFNSTASFL